MFYTLKIYVQPLCGLENFQLFFFRGIYYIFVSIIRWPVRVRVIKCRFSQILQTRLARIIYTENALTGGNTLLS